MKVCLEKSVQFEAAHRLTRVPAEHSCARWHGHSFRIDIAVEGEVNPATGWLIDYRDIKEAWEPLGRLLDHSNLNDIEGLENPTSENLALWIWERLTKRLPQLTEITIHETCTARCRYRGE